MSFMPRPLTEEEQAINDAIDMHRDAMKDEFQTFAAAIVLYFIGLTLTVIGSNGDRLEHLGNALLFCAVVLYIVHLLLGLRTRKYRRAARELMLPYWRRKALPFYQELVEMFAEKPGVHLHLAEDGKIVVTDKRMREGQKWPSDN